MVQVYRDQRGDWPGVLQCLLQSLGTSRSATYFTKEKKVKGYTKVFETRVYFIVRIGGHIRHHSMKYCDELEDMSAVKVAHKAVRRICKLHRINLLRLVQKYVRRVASVPAVPAPEEELGGPSAPAPVPLSSPTPPSPEERHRVTGNRQEYLRQFVPAVRPESPPAVRNSWVFYSDSEPEVEESSFSSPEWEPSY